MTWRPQPSSPLPSTRSAPHLRFCSRLLLRIGRRPHRLLAIGCRWGVEGAAASRLVYAVFWFALYFRFMYRIVRFDLGGLMLIYLRSGLASAAALIPLALTYAFWAPPQAITLVQLALASGAGVVCWLVSLALLRHPVLGEILGLAAGVPIMHRCVPVRFRAA